MKELFALQPSDSGEQSDGKRRMKDGKVRFVDYYGISTGGWRPCSGRSVQSKAVSMEPT